MTVECEVCLAPVFRGDHKKHLKACWAILAGTAGLVRAPERAPEYIDCPRCHGKGEVPVPTLLWGHTMTPCSTCQGTGLRPAVEPGSEQSPHS